jgi:excisionase family DNA binding protein
MPKLLLNHGEAADLLGVSAPTLLKMRESGQVPYLRLNSGKLGVRYSTRALENWISQRSRRRPG